MAALLLPDSAQVDALCPKRSSAGQHEARIVGQLLTLLDGSTALGPSQQNASPQGGGLQGAAPGHILVVGTTSRPNAVDPALRRPGRWEPCTGRRWHALTLCSAPTLQCSQGTRGASCVDWQNHSSLRVWGVLLPSYCPPVRHHLLCLVFVALPSACFFVSLLPPCLALSVNVFQLPGCRLEREILVGMPDASARASILRLLTQKLPLDETVNLQR